MVSVKKFYAEWCGPCKVLTPVMENVKSKFAQVQFESVDIDSQFEVAQKYYVRSVPTVIIEKDGKEVGRFGVTVNAIAPGFIKSVMSDSMPEEIIKAGVAQIPVGRIGTAEDMGHSYLFLASKEAGFISGITLHANGGAMPM